MKTIAEAFGVDVRTVYRYLEGGASWFDVQVGDWRAVFEVRPGGCPIRVSPWSQGND